MKLELNKIPGYYRVKLYCIRLDFAFLKRQINLQPLDNFLIFSDPRGGSTWLMELIQEMTKTPILWEPLHVNKVDEIKKLGFGMRQYIPENETWPEAKRFFLNLFRGKILNKWVMQQTSANQLKQANNVIIKFCRGNALLPYLTNNFNFKYKPILFVRHPFAVVASQLKHGAWLDLPSTFKIPNTVFNNRFIENKEYLMTLKTKEETLVAVWCITNKIPLEHSKNNINWITVTYESLLMNPEHTIDRILKQWDVKFNINKLDFKKQSRTTIQGSPNIDDERLKYWQNSFTKEQISKMKNVLDYFEIKLYSENFEPLIDYK